VLFSSGAGGWALLWDVQENAWVGPLLGHRSMNFAAEISPDGKRVVAAQSPTEVQVYQASTARPIGKPIRSWEGLNGATFTPDSQRVFLSCRDGTARMYWAESGSPVGKVMTHEWGVTFVAFNPNGTRVCTASANQLRLWDVATGAAVSDWHEVSMGCFGDHSGDPVFSPDGRVLCIAEGPRVRLLDAMTGQAIVRDLAHADDVHQTGFSSDGARLFTKTWSGAVSFWDVMTGSRISAPINVKPYAYTCFADGGRRALTCAQFDVAQLWDVETSIPVGPPIECLMRHHDVSPDGKRIALIGGDRFSGDGEALKLLDAETGDVIASSRPDQRGDRWAGSVMFSEDGRRLLVAGMSDEGSLWDGLTGAAIGSLNLAGEIFVAGFDPAGQHVVMSSGKGTARIWRADNGDPTGSPIDIPKRVAQSSRHLN
jgi:WD40 repeat protein